MKVRIVSKQYRNGRDYYEAQRYSWLFGWKTLYNHYGIKMQDHCLERLKEDINRMNESNVVEEWTI